MRQTKGPGVWWIALIIVGVFLYVPIVVLMAMSFNASESPFNWGGFSLRWYVELFGNGAIMSAALTSLYVAVGATLIATPLGTLLAIGLTRYSRSRALEGVAMAPALAPELLMGLGLLSLYSMLAIPKSETSILLAHAAFGIAFVVAIVRARLAGSDPALEEAARDLGSTEFGALWRVTIPMLGPTIAASALLVFTLSLDEFVIALFTAGTTTTTLPILIYSQIRTGVSPEINALGTILVLLSVIAVVIGARVFRRTETRT